MCEKCQELDQKITHYRRFTKEPFDALTLERIKDLVSALEQQRGAMHEGAAE